MAEDEVITEEQPPQAATQDEPTQLLTSEEENILAQLLAAPGNLQRHRITNPYPASPPTGPIVVSDFTGLSDSTGVNAYTSLQRWHAQGLVNALAKWGDGTFAYFLTHLGKRFIADNGGATIRTLTPSTGVHAATNVALVVNGVGFRSTSQIYFNSAAQTTTLKDPYDLQCTVATLPATAGNVPVLVKDSATGFISNTLQFAVT